MSQRLIKPQALKPGDTVAVVRPASRLDLSQYRRTLKALRNSGLCVAEWGEKTPSDSFFSAPDQSRAEELHWAFSQPGVKAVFCCRGGYGTQRALRLISRSQRQQWNPKILVGYSDITYLHQWIQNELGWVSIHGPLCGMIPSPRVKTLVKNVQQLCDRPSQQVWSEVRTLRSSLSGRGKLVGGNLSLFQVAGPAALPREPILLAIEEVNEDFYRIDRALQILLEAGYEKFIKGIIVGTLTGCGKNDSRTFRFERVIETLKSLTRGPIWLNARFGHGLSDRQRLLPLGCKVEIKGKIFSILESVVT